ncbi:hypothetical protein M434DRAFT_16803 [Hypoxylon sp. CO27-5]|nr:hypothetical protein M434DRAFT_16803 [Hypoxylon sp. CO27-5]
MGRTGYDVTYIARKCPPRSQEHCEQNHSTSTHPPSIHLPLPLRPSPSSSSFNQERNSTRNSTRNNTPIINTYSDQNGFLAPPSLYASRVHAPRQQHHSNRQPSPGTRLSSGYARTTGQYTLYNQRTGRGWQGSDQATSTTSPGLGTPTSTGVHGAAPAVVGVDTDMANAHESTLRSSHHRGVGHNTAVRRHDGRIRKIGRGVRSAVQRVAQASRAAGRFMMARQRHRSRALGGAGTYTPERAGSMDPLLACIDPRILPQVPKITITAASDDEKEAEGE